ncbi:helix-turn-helix transcriptional regulator [Paenibacillus sp. P25]|nr:helix-turn-helix transcriptional regulator [Paenibacillus sp. P25]
MLWLNAGEGGPDRADQELQSMTELMGKLEAELERRLPYLSEAVKLITIVSDPIASVEQLYSALKETTPRETALFYHRSGQAIAVHTAARETSLISLKDKADVERRWTQLAEQPGELVAYVQEEWAAWAASHKVLPAELKAWAVQLYGRVCAASGREEPEPETGLARLLEAQSVSQLAGDLSGLIEAVPGEPRKCRREVRLAKRILSERLAEPLTLTSVAEEVGLSSFYLSRLFREEVGESFNAYLTRLRVDKAIRLLQTTPLKVYEVAERVGIPSYRYFSVLFRNRTGVSPTDYKKG